LGALISIHDFAPHLLTHDITFGIGPAGTGKTFLAVACAVDALERTACSASC
jgi:phosphate starvation-inducible PhoH-like protein